MEWLFSWEVSTFVIAIAVGIAFAVLAMNDFKLAKLFFLIAAADTTGGLVMWGWGSNRSAYLVYTFVFLGVGCVGVLALAAIRYVDKKEPVVKAAPKLEIGVILGADKGIGIDAVVDCSKPVYTCFSEEQAKNTSLIFDVGSKSWARVIFQMKNIGDEKIENSKTHIDSPNPISIDFAPRPDPSRLPRNVIDLFDGNGIVPFSISKANTDIPLDIFVPPGIQEFDLYLNSFGDNMVTDKRKYHFLVRRDVPKP